ncbi:uncharacterized protein [Amphiura filiformis]|uniref:uncharacterized protein n=1 Tax=Amphiura filiformis TaxID=82378 RepID=UPI003B2231BD
MEFATNDDLNEHKTIHGSNTSQPQEDETEYRNKVADSLVAIECDKCRLQFPILARFNSHKCISNIKNGVAILRANSIPRKGKAHLEKHVKMQHLADSATKDNQQQTTKNVSEISSLNEDHSDTQSGSTHQAPHFQPKSIHDTTSDVIKHKKRHSSVASGVAVGADCPLGHLKRERRNGKIGTRRRGERKGKEGEREGKGKERAKRSERGGREGKKKREREERESKYRDDTFATNNVCHPGLTMLATRLKWQHSLNRWMCSKCTLGFATHDILKAHELIVHNSHCTCDHCKMQLGRNLSVVRPSKMVHSVDIANKDNQQKTTKKAKKRPSKMVHSVNIATKYNQQKTTKKAPQISIAYECDKCKKRFLMLTEFDQHKCISDTLSGSTHQGPGIQSKCNHCNMRLAATSDVAKHKKRQRSVLQWMCRKCGMGFATNDDLNEHKTIHEASDTSQPHEDETEYRNKVASSLVAIECDKCRQQFPNLARFSSHKCISDTRNGVAILRATSIPRKRNSHPQCEHCNRHFGTKPNLERSRGSMGLTTKDNREKNNKVSSTSNRNNGGPNVSSHNEMRVTLNECLLCNKVFSSEEDFAQHNKSHHLKDRIGEATCLSTTNKNDELETSGDPDKSVHNEPTLFESMLRTKYFSIHKDLVKLCETQLNKDTERVCPYCDRKFEGKIAFSRHMKRHISDTPYECMQCLEKFSSREELTQHRTNHTDKIALSCYKCNKAFKVRTYLQQHVNRHELVKQETEIVCMYCDRTFKRKVSLALHMKRHGGETPFECMQCFGRFSCREELTRHRTSHVDTKALNCHQCNKAFKSQTYLLMHVNNHERKKQLYRSKYNGQKRETKKRRRHVPECEMVCMYCDRTINGKAGLNSHMKRHVGETPFECKQCGDKFPSREELTQHRTNHVDDKIALKCHHCVQTFETRIKLQIHLRKFTTGYKRKVYKRKRYKCDKCETKHDSNYQRDIHMREAHTGEEIFQCTNCGKKFLQESELSQHVETGCESLRCEECDKLFMRKSSLKDHMISMHSKEKPPHLQCKYCLKSLSRERQLRQHIKSIHEIDASEHSKCKFCEKTFTVKVYLRQHIKRRHPDTLQYKCTHCGHAFSTSRHLAAHITRHHCGDETSRTNDKPLCTYCGKCFSKMYHLRRHQRIHTGEKPYLCPLCGKRFAKSFGLTSHMKTHDGKKEYLCNLCGKGFIHPYSLTSHMKHNHKDEKRLDEDN